MDMHDICPSRQVIIVKYVLEELMSQASRRGW